MTKEARFFIQNTVVEDEFDSIQDEIYAIVPEGRKNIAVVRAWLESKRKTIIFLVWKTKSGHFKYVELRRVINGKELHIDQIVVQNKTVIVSIDTGEGYNRKNLMEKQEIPLSDLKGLQ